MFKAKFGDRIDAWIYRLLPFVFRWRVSPNAFSALGALVSLVAAAAFARGRFVTGGLLALVAGLFDLMDGAIARRNGAETRFGAFLDSTLDRVSDMALLLGVVVFFAVAGQPHHVLLAGYALAASVLVSYAKARARIEGPSIEEGLLERGERVVILALGAILGLVVPALWVIAIGSTITVIQRSALAYREMARIDAAERGVGEHG